MVKAFLRCQIHTQSYVQSSGGVEHDESADLFEQALLLFIKTSRSLIKIPSLSGAAFLWIVVSWSSIVCPLVKQKCGSQNMVANAVLNSEVNCIADLLAFVYEPRFPTAIDLIDADRQFCVIGGLYWHRRDIQARANSPHCRALPARPWCCPRQCRPNHKSPAC